MPQTPYAKQSATPVVSSTGAETVLSASGLADTSTGAAASTPAASTAEAADTAIMFRA
jgi:hypothetical protein